MFRGRGECTGEHEGTVSEPSISKWQTKPVNLYGYLIQKNNKMADKVVQCYGIVQTWEINCYTPNMEN